jgi:hypothetical protein
MGGLTVAGPNQPESGFPEYRVQRNLPISVKAPEPGSENSRPHTQD